MYRGTPSMGDYWCCGILTSDFELAMQTAIAKVKELHEDVYVYKYTGMYKGITATAREVAVIRAHTL